MTPQEKAIQEAKDAVARRHQFSGWENLLERVKSVYKINQYENEAILLYHVSQTEKIKTMSLLGDSGSGLKHVPSCIPMTLLNEEWAERNHGQSLDKLNSRGGLSISEMLAIAKRQRCGYGKDTQEMVDELNELISYHKKQLQGTQTEKETDAVEFADWINNSGYCDVYSDELRRSAWVNSKEHSIYIHGSDHHRTELVHNHGETTKELYAKYKSTK